MSPRLQRLRAEIASDASAFESRLDELARVARTIDGGLHEGADWHQALLESMTLEIESVRPAVLSAESVTRLRPLLAFRHFFRHAYAATWDAGRLAALRDDALAVRAPLRADLARLDTILRDAARPDRER